MTMLALGEAYPKGTVTFSLVSQDNSNKFLYEFSHLLKKSTKENFCIISSDNHLIPFLRVIDFLCLGASKKESKTLRRESILLLKEFKLNEQLIEHKINTLSSEECLFVQLIYALIVKHDTLIIDSNSYHSSELDIDSYYELLGTLAKRYNIAITIVS